MLKSLDEAIREVLATEEKSQWDPHEGELERSASQSFQKLLHQTARWIHNEPDYVPSLLALEVLDDFAAKILKAAEIVCNSRRRPE